MLGSTQAGFRYGAVLLLTLAVAMTLIGCPPADWSRALALTLEFLALMVVVVTSREHEQVRRRRAATLGAVAIALVVATGVGLVPAAMAFVFGALLSCAIPAGLVGGLIRLVRRRGVTLQVVAGAIALYMLAGLAFAYAIGFTAAIESGPYFAQSTHTTVSACVYYSFTVLTTTGFGDLTAAQSLGRALAVLEMLAGQLYLVTVIGVIVGDLAGRRRAAVRP